MEYLILCSLHSKEYIEGLFAAAQENTKRTWFLHTYMIRSARRRLNDERSADGSTPDACSSTDCIQQQKYYDILYILNL